MSTKLTIGEIAKLNSSVNDMEQFVNVELNAIQNLPSRAKVRFALLNLRKLADKLMQTEVRVA